MQNSQERELPWNNEAEQAVLGSVLIEGDAYHDVAPFLHAEDFYREAHRLIFTACATLAEGHHPLDVITITDQLARRQKLDAAGGYAYLASLANHVPTSYNAERYGRIVARAALARRLITAAGALATLGYDEPDVETAVTEAERLVRAATGG